MAGSFFTSRHTPAPEVRTPQRRVPNFFRIWKGRSTDEDSKRAPSQASSKDFLPSAGSHPRPARATTPLRHCFHRRNSLFRRAAQGVR